MPGTSEGCVGLLSGRGCSPGAPQGPHSPPENSWVSCPPGQSSVVTEEGSVSRRGGAKPPQGVGWGTGRDPRPAPAPQGGLLQAEAGPGGRPRPPFLSLRPQWPTRPPMGQWLSWAHAGGAPHASRVGPQLQPMDGGPQPPGGPPGRVSPAAAGACPSRPAAGPRAGRAAAAARRPSRPAPARACAAGPSPEGCAPVARAAPPAPPWPAGNHRAGARRLVGGPRRSSPGLWRRSQHSPSSQQGWATLPLFSVDAFGGL